MEQCCFGDLNVFFTKRGLSQQQKLELMLEISKGVEYLHSRNIIHRHIKPGNILDAHDSPIHAKLTDFDISKFLEENYNTSLITSNVGTSDFKAPEFFMEDEHHQVNYHRNVDIFASGLTFLAIPGADQENRKLASRIETHHDNCDLFTPIGQTIATRIRYKEKQLRVVKIEKDDETTATTVISRERITLRKLIQKMTCCSRRESVFLHLREKIYDTINQS